MEDESETKGEKQRLVVAVTGERRLATQPLFHHRTDLDVASQTGDDVVHAAVLYTHVRRQGTQALLLPKVKGHHFELGRRPKDRPHLRHLLCATHGRDDARAGGQDLLRNSSAHNARHARN